MIDLYYWTTPNGHKISIFLEEAGLPYKIHPVNITKNEQMEPAFLKISPNNKIPAIVDEGLALFESGAILLYLSRKYGKFSPKNLPDEMRMLQWLFWQVGGIGPMSGQAMHFAVFAKEKIPYAIERYKDEVKRLYKVADTELGIHRFLGSEEYSIADIATYPWIVPYTKLGITLSDYPNLTRWFKDIEKRPAVIRAYTRAKEINPDA
jgi:GST-like protein